MGGLLKLMNVINLEINGRKLLKYCNKIEIISIKRILIIKIDALKWPYITLNNRLAVKQDHNYNKNENIYSNDCL